MNNNININDDDNNNNTTNNKADNTTTTNDVDNDTTTTNTNTNNNKGVLIYESHTNGRTKRVSKQSTFRANNYVNPFMLGGFEEKQFCKGKGANKKQQKVLNIIDVDDDSNDMFISKANYIKEAREASKVMGESSTRRIEHKVKKGHNPTNVSTNVRACDDSYQEDANLLSRKRIRGTGCIGEQYNTYGDDDTAGKPVRRNTQPNDVDAGGHVLKVTVEDWLKNLGMDKYVPNFKMHEVDKYVLPLLTYEDLKDMGISCVGARRKLYNSIQKLHGGM